MYMCVASVLIIAIETDLTPASGTNGIIKLPVIRNVSTARAIGERTTSLLWNINPMNSLKL